MADTAPKMERLVAKSSEFSFKARPVNDETCNPRLNVHKADQVSLLLGTKSNCQGLFSGLQLHVQIVAEPITGYI